ncbi:DNA polymerase III subunit alpha [Candidatus Nomurabacteria bacterium]|nr:DNA polymerase III subunit alpha [Candidatus Nomurabacteria bacterium]
MGVKQKSTDSIKGGAKLISSDFVHLHNHTQYSLLDGLTKIPKLIDFVAESGMESVAITDHGTLSGVIDFYKTANAGGVKPIIGMEAYVASRKHTDKDPQKDKARFHLIIIAMNNVGYQNLMRLSTIANLDGFYYYPRIDHELLEEYNEGLIILSACMGGEIGQAISSGNIDQAEEIASWYKSVFGDRYYLEIQDHGHPENELHSPEQKVVNDGVLELGRKLEIPVVVTCDAHYLRHEDQEAHEALLCVGTGSYVSETNRMSLKEFPLHVETPDNIIARWGNDHPEVVKNTKAIADRCEINLEFGKILIPKFPVPKTDDEKSLLHKLTYRGLAWRYGGVEEAKSKRITMEEAKNTLSKEVLERAEFELGVMDNMGFNGYFLIVADFINWGKDKGIIFGPGRGSAAGSIVAYALRITELDPLKYDLLFERFLNPDRISMPDIDIDIQDTRRNEVIQYCSDKYGSDRVANIVTFGTMAARAAIRDVARVLEVPYAVADRLSKLVPPPIQGRHIPLATSIKEDPDLRREYETSEEAKRVIDLAIRLEGTVRSHGVHAAGVVIAPDDIVKFVPLERSQKQVLLADGTKQEVISTQYPMGPVEDLGLLKMDFLGLSNLTILRNALRIIKRVYNTAIELEEIPLDDDSTYELFQKGDTTGVFQLESAGMKRYLKELKPTTFEDIVAMVALYRPGPMQFIGDFLNRKHGNTKISYPHKSMENALKNTYGILVYQEQVMQISKEVCGFTGGEADTLRKAIGKKNASLLAKMKDKMIEGGQKHSDVPKDIMERFWKQLEEFAAYCFNKSHAACYGMIAYWTAYLKSHYPDAFMAALMTSDAGDTDRLAIEISECRHMGIEVLLPDVNESYVEFAVVPGKNQIRFGMSAVKNVGVGAVEEIIKVRDEGRFVSVMDFLERVDTRKVNRKTWESLIKSGGFDSLGQSRGDLLHNLDGLLALGSKIHKEKLTNQADLFGSDDGKSSYLSSEYKFVSAPEQIKEHEMLLWERELLGLYLSSHPLDGYEGYLVEHTLPLAEINNTMDSKTVTVGGVVTSIRSIVTKNGAKMAFVKIEDKTDECELIVFPGVYEKLNAVWEQDKVIIAKGKVSYKDRDGNIGQELKIMADQANIVTEEDAKAYQPKGKKPKPPKGSKPTPKNPSNSPKGSTNDKPIQKQTLFVQIKDPADHDRLLKLRELASSYSGDQSVVLVLGDEDSKTAMRMPFKVKIGEELTSKLHEFFEEKCIAIRAST